MVVVVVEVEVVDDEVVDDDVGTRVVAVDDRATVVVVAENGTVEAMANVVVGEIGLSTRVDTVALVV